MFSILILLSFVSRLSTDPFPSYVTVLSSTPLHSIFKYLITTSTYRFTSCSSRKRWYFSFMCTFNLTTSPTQHRIHYLFHSPVAPSLPASRLHFSAPPPFVDIDIPNCAGRHLLPSTGTTRPGPAPEFKSNLSALHFSPVPKWKATFSHLLSSPAIPSATFSAEDAWGTNEIRDGVQR